MAYLDFNFDDDFDEEKDEEKWQWEGTDALIFLVDCTAPMFAKLRADEQEAILLSLKCVHSTFTSKIISSENDLIGVVLYGTDSTQNSSNFPHISVLLDLGQPSADRILKIEAITKEDKGLDKFQNEFGSSLGYSMSDALWVCQSMFSNSRQKLGHKRILLFTSVDDPHPGDDNKVKQARSKARDLQDNNIQLELMHLGSNFDLSAFYQGLHILEEGEHLPDPSERLEELLSRVRRKNHKKRSSGRVTLNLGGNIQCAVTTYNLVRPTRIPTKTSLDRRDNTEVKRMQQKYLADTGEEMMRSDLEVYQEYGNKKIKMTMDENRGLKSFGDIGFNLMGFKPLERIKPYHHVAPASFLYPDEYNIKGSTTLFAALLDRCNKRKKAMVGWWVRSKASAPRLVALLPQEEELDESGLQVTPPGFHVVRLPFADDIRHLPSMKEACPRASQEQVDAMSVIVKKLRAAAFSPDQIENPVLQTFWSNIEALALDRDNVDPIEDTTQPDYEGIRKRVGKYVETFKELVYPEDYDPLAAAPKKRGAPAGGDGSKGAKKVREDKYPDIDMRAEANANKVQKLTVDVLKNFLMLQGVTVTGKKKADLVQEVYAHFGTTT